jgi:hypothetical protein
MKKLKRKFERRISFTLNNRIKSLGENLTREMKEFYNENCKMLMKEIEVDTKKWKDIPCSWIGIINIDKMSTLLNM